MASGCAAAFGPGYTIEKQRVEVSYTQQASDRVSVRASYQLKNTGTKPLELLDFRYPDPLAVYVKDLNAEWRGETISFPAPRRGRGANEFHMPLRERWSPGENGEFIVSYTVPISTHWAAVVPNHAATFFLPVFGWLPVLMPPSRGAFTTGGAPPSKWDLVVSVPESYRVRASGNERGREKNGARGVRFEQQPGKSFDAYVVAGPYAEQQVHTPTGTVMIWSGNPVSGHRVSELAKRVSADAAFFAAEFGGPESKKEPITLIECWSADTESIGQLNLGSECFTLPRTVIVSPKFLEDDPSDEMMRSLDDQLSWQSIYFSAIPKENGPLFPTTALGDYGAVTIAISHNPAARDAMVRNLLRRVPIGTHKDEPLFRVGVGQFEGIEERARAESTLFFLALDDRCGAQNVHKGIARMSRLLRGQSWDLSDFRSAVEAECGGPVLESFFREWTHGPGIPAEFRARYSEVQSGK